MKNKIRLGTRGSKLALVQSKEISERITAFFPEIKIDLVILKTEGDNDTVSPLSGFGGRGAFVKAIENELINGNIDIAVHSLKDLPSKLPEGLILGAVPFREDPRDVVISRKYTDITDLPAGAVIGTGSDRRRIQIAEICPGAVFKEIRGNVDTRIRKMETGEYDCIILAAAGVKRLNLSDCISRFIETKTMIPAPGQGSIGVECRENDKYLKKILEGIDNPEIHFCSDLERSFISELELGCHSPVGAYARFENVGIAFSGFAGDIKTGEIFRKEFVFERKSVSEAVLEAAKKIKLKIKSL